MSTFLSSFLPGPVDYLDIYENKTQTSPVPLVSEASVYISNFKHLLPHYRGWQSMSAYHARNMNDDLKGLRVLSIDVDTLSD